MFYMRLLPFFAPEAEDGAARGPEEAQAQEASVAAAQEGDSSKAAPGATGDEAPPVTAAPTAPEPVAEAEKAVNEASEAAQRPESRLQRHISRLMQQEAELRRELPGFDLRRELRRSPMLRRLTAPGSPLSLREAVTAVNLPRLAAMREERLVRLVQESVARSMASGFYRPREMRGLAAGEDAQPLDREQLKERIRSGERIYAGR